MTINFLQFLKSKKVLTQEEVDFFIKKYQEGKYSFESLILKEARGIDAEKLLELKGEYYNLPIVQLEKQTSDKNVFGLLPKETITNYQIIPFDSKDGVIRVGMVNPENLKAREAVDFLARQKGWDTQFYVINEKAFLKSLESSGGSLHTQVTEALEYAGKERSEDDNKKTKNKEEDFEEVVKSAPVSKMVSVILRHAVEGGASDIHIEPMDNETRVRYRIDGELHSTISLPKFIHNSIVSRVKVLANLKLDETRKPQDGRIHLEMEGKQIDFRVSTLPLSGSEKVVMRILDVSRGAPTLNDLGFMGRNLEVIERQIWQPNGMFLVTGPTGSGKSTTLFSALSILNKEQVNIVTLEDPVEYYLPGANQSQVRPEVNFTFASGLRSILRQDPDIIMVGEIRDNETASLAVQAALTGHIVLSTLHTNDAAGAIPRLLDMKVEKFLLSSTLNIIQAQRLVRKVCPHCKKECKVAPDLLETAKTVLAAIPDKSLYQGVDRGNPIFYKGEGCAKCGKTGFSGRISVAEVIQNTREMQDIIAKGFDYSRAEEELKNQGFISMLQDGIMKAALGLTTADEVVVATKE